MSKHQEKRTGDVFLEKGFLILVAAFACQAVFDLICIEWLSSFIDVSSKLFGYLLTFDTLHIKFIMLGLRLWRGNIDVTFSGLQGDQKQSSVAKQVPVLWSRKSPWSINKRTENWNKRWSRFYSKMRKRRHCNMEYLLMYKWIFISVWINICECNWHTIKCAYLKCTICLVLIYVHTCETITTMKIGNMSIIPKRLRSPVIIPPS